MKNQGHLDILKQGVEVWNTWREQHPEEKPDLGGLGKTDFSGIDLSGVNLSRADLFRVEFRNANFSGANLSNANLTYANLQGANLSRADLSRADLNGASLGETNLSNVNFSGARLSGAGLSGRDLRGLDFSGADLSGAYLRGTDLRKANLSGVDLRGATLSKNISHTEHLQLMDLSASDWDEINFEAADLRDANLSSALLDGADLSAMNLRGAILEKTNLNRANLSNTDLSGVNLNGANLTRAILVETKLENATLTNCSIYGISAWNVQLQGATQLDLLITDKDEPIITVDNLEVAQFIYLLLNNQKIRDVIDTVAKKAVLILGRFTPERKAVLDALRVELRIWGFLPILCDFDKPARRDITETVSTLAHLARFVIADITDPRSIPQELTIIVHNLPSVPVQPLILESQHEYGMFEHFRRCSSVLPLYYYKDQASLLQSLKENVIDPAEQKAQELEKQ